MDLQDARKFMFGWGIKNDASVWDDNEREHLLACLLEEYHQSKLKNIVDLADVSDQRGLLIAFSKWWNGQEYSKDSKELDAFDEYYSNL
jgi:hypothetical protein